jgi:hypothetical protein
MNREKLIRNQIANLEKSKKFAMEKADFRSFSQICQDIRCLERELSDLETANEQLERISP